MIANTVHYLIYSSDIAFPVLDSQLILEMGFKSRSADSTFCDCNQILYGLFVPNNSLFCSVEPAAIYKERKAE